MINATGDVKSKSLSMLAVLSRILTDGVLPIVNKIVSQFDEIGEGVRQDIQQ